MHLSNPLACSAALLTLTLGTAASAEIVNVTDANDDGVIESITLQDGRVILGSDIVQGSLTSITDNSPGFFVPDGTAQPSDVSSVIDNDLNYRNGLLNVQQLTFTFNTGIVNNADGPDFFIADYGTDQDDDYSITINGQTVGIDKNGEEFVTAGDFTIDTYNSTSSVSGTSGPDALDGLSYTGPGDSTSKANFQDFELSSFGVAVGDSITSLTINTAPGGDNTSILDVSIIGGFQAVPEPASIALLGAGALCLLPRRRR
jgi:hypothetical protein